MNFCFATAVLADTVSGTQLAGEHPEIFGIYSSGARLNFNESSGNLQDAYRVRAR